MKPLLCLRNEPVDSLGVVPDTFRAQGVDVVLLDAWKPLQVLPEPTAYSGIIVFGGSMNVDDITHYPFLSAERAFVERTRRAGVPFLGICLGGQLLARAFGAAVGRAFFPEIGFMGLAKTAAGTSDPLLSTIPEDGRVFQWHEDAFTLPLGAELLARGVDGAPQAFRLDAACWGVQFHPEVTRKSLELSLQRTIDDGGETWGRSALDLRTEVERYASSAERNGRALFRAFLEQMRNRAEECRPFAGSGHRKSHVVLSREV